MLVFTLVFGVIGKFPSAGSPYPILVYVAMLPWQLFSSSLSDAGGSLVANANLISKVYFPRLVLPASAIITALIDFAVSAAILVGLMAWYGQWPDWRLVTLPAFFLLALAASLGGGIWITALNVKYRDFRYVVPFLVQLGMYVSPVGFTSAIVPQQWRLLYSINPMVGVIDGFRWALLGGNAALYLPGIVASSFAATLLLASGLAYFRRTERSFADII
jgi:lipopolysaccharide transport system permease protein